MTNSKTIFIPEEQLGTIVMGRLQMAPLETTKPGRVRAFNDCVKLLRLTKVVVSTQAICGLSYGLDNTGTRGVHIVLCPIAEAVGGQHEPK